MNEIRNFDKMKNIAKILRKVLKVITWILVTIGFVLVAAEVIIMLVNDKYFMVTDLYKGNMAFSIDGWFNYEVIGEAGTSISFKPVILTILPTILLAIVFYLINIKQIQKILKTISEDKPFDIKNAKSLSIMGINFIVASVVFQIAGGLVAEKAIAMLNVDLGSIGMLPDGSMLFTGLLLMILSSVFKYGHYLQEEYNDTV